MNGMSPRRFVQGQPVTSPLELKDAIANPIRKREQNRVSAARRNRIRYPVRITVEEIAPAAIGISDLPAETVESQERPDLGPGRACVVAQEVSHPDPIAGLRLAGRDLK
jgi:hypothetical protein